MEHIEDPGATSLGPIFRLSRDLKLAAKTMSDREARYLVDAYYMWQEVRKRAGNQILSMKRTPEHPEEPHSVIVWEHDQSETMEAQIKRALEVYTETNIVGRWARSNTGIGPVIAAGLMAHIDIKRCPTAGHIWSFAGLEPRSV